MGQRLVLSVLDNGERICNIYYHWSAYTSSAFHELKKIVQALNDEVIEEKVLDTSWDEHGKMILKWKVIRSEEHIGIEDPILKIALALKAFGGGFDSDDAELAIKEFGPNAPIAKDRNEGLVAISEKVMESTDGWAEGEATIDISNKTCRNDCFIFYSNIEEYKELFECTYAEPVHCPINLDEIPFDKLDECINWFDPPEEDQKEENEKEKKKMVITGETLIENNGDLFTIVC